MSIHPKNIQYAGLCILLLLSGCGGDMQQTKAEHICKSCKPYYVRGSWHHPQTHYEYDEEGLASWYGPGFHGRPKPYGEPFDQNALTAAHRTLPLPTVAEVTNTATGKSLIVLIDDRGPYVYPGRIIDLSIGSAKELGTYSKGIGKVRVRSLVEESRALAKYLTRYGSKGRDPSGRTWRQILDQEILPKRDEPHKNHKPQTLTDVLEKIAAPTSPTPTTPSTFVEAGPNFATLEQAQKYAAQLRPPKTQQQLVKKIVQVTQNGKHLYKVRIGPFASSDQGKAFVQKIISSVAKSK